MDSKSIEGNVFLVDSRYLNKIILASGQNQEFSSYKEGSDETETYGIQIVEPNSEEDENVVSTVEVVDEDSSHNLMHPVMDCESHTFVPCMQGGSMVMAAIPKTGIEPFLDSEIFVADLKTDNNEEVYEQIKTSPIEEQPQIAPNRPPIFNKAYHNRLSKLDRSFCLRKSKLLLSACYRNNNNSKTKFLPTNTGYSEERYSIYSGTKSSLRYHGVTDSLIMIPPNIFKRQITDVSDTIQPILRMPSTKQELRALDLTVTKLFSQPCAGHGPRLTPLFTRNCSSRPQEDSIDTRELGLLPVGYQPPIDRSKIKRITRKRKSPEDKQSQLLQKMLHMSAKSGQDHGSAFSRIIPAEYLTIEEPMMEWVTEDGCYILSDEGMGDESQQIYIIHDEPQQAEEVEQQQSIGHTNMEVLLAAAAEGQMSAEEVYFCQESSEAEDENEVSSEQIILLTEDDHHEVITPD